MRSASRYLRMEKTFTLEDEKKHEIADGKAHPSAPVHLGTAVEIHKKEGVL